MRDHKRERKRSRERGRERTRERKNERQTTRESERERGAIDGLGMTSLRDFIREEVDDVVMMCESWRRAV